MSEMNRNADQEILEKELFCPKCGEQTLVVVSSDDVKYIHYQCNCCGTTFRLPNDGEVTFKQYRASLDRMIRALPASSPESEIKFYNEYSDCDPQCYLYELATQTGYFKKHSKQTVADAKDIKKEVDALISSGEGFPLDHRGNILKRKCDRYFKRVGDGDKRRRHTVVTLVTVALILLIAAIVYCLLPNMVEADWTAENGMVLETKSSMFKQLTTSSYDFTAREITAEESVYVKAQNALKNETAVFKIFELNLLSEGKNASLNGVGRVTAAIPETYHIHNAAVYEVCADGTVQQIPSEISEQAKTVSFESDHLGVFVIAERRFHLTFTDVYGTVHHEQRLFWGELAEQPKQPQKAGFEFGGWQVNGEDWAFDEDIVTQDTVFTVNWIPIKYTVTYHLNGGVWEGDYLQEYDLSMEEILWPTPKYSSYAQYIDFAGWYLDSELSEPFAKDVESNPRSLTLYAKWNLAEIYAGIATTPDLKAKDGLTRFIVDWSKDTDLDVVRHKRQENLGCTSSTGIDINNTVTEVIFIGNSGTMYENLHLRLVEFAYQQELRVTFDNFSFVTNAKQAITPSVAVQGDGNQEEHGMILNLHFTGKCSIVGRKVGGNVLTGFHNVVNITGDGETTLRATDGDPLNGSAGGTALSATEIHIQTSGKISIIGGNGCAGSRGYDADGDPEHGGAGDDGGNGGVAIKAETVYLNGGTVIVTGGNGGNGGRGGKGDEGNFLDYDGNGGNGGRGGDGAYAIEAERIEFAESGLSVKATGGSGGNGGNGGNGGSGGINESKGGSGGSGGKGQNALSCPLSTAVSNVTVINGTNGNKGSNGRGT